MLSDIAIFLLLAMVIGFVSIILFNNIALFSFLFIEYSLGTMHNPTEYPTIKLGHYIKNFWLECFYIMSKYYLLPLKWCDLTVKTSTNLTTNTVILLVHGYCRNQCDWLWLRKQLQDTQCPVFTINLQPKFASIATIARDSLPKKIVEIKKLTNCSNIILIGHSMGGIVSSYYNEYLDKEKLIKAVITIGSPLHGTKVAISGVGQNSKEMCPDTEFLQQLRASASNNPSKYYHISSKFDNIIFPWRSALLDTTMATQQFVLPSAGHLEMLHRKDVAMQLNMWIQKIID